MQLGAEVIPFFLAAEDDVFDVGKFWSVRPPLPFRSLRTEATLTRHLLLARPPSCATLPRREPLRTAA